MDGRQPESANVQFLVGVNQTESYAEDESQMVTDYASSRTYASRQHWGGNVEFLSGLPDSRVPTSYTAGTTTHPDSQGVSGNVQFLHEIPKAQPHITPQLPQQSYPTNVTYHEHGLQNPSRSRDSYPTVAGQPPLTQGDIGAHKQVRERVLNDSYQIPASAPGPGNLTTSTHSVSTAIEDHIRRGLIVGNLATANSTFLNSAILGGLEDDRTRATMINASMSNEQFLKTLKKRREIVNFNAKTTRDGTSTPNYTSPTSLKTSWTAFRYPPLSDKSHSLRLIRIGPSYKVGSSQELRCTMISTQAWMTQTPYECLSYCWGNGGKTKKILVKALEVSDSYYQSFPVTENLHNALKSLESTHASQWLWIDAISINQDDAQERSAQVAMMKDIYNRASGVVIWLGEDKAAGNAYSIISWLTSRFTGDTKCWPHFITGPQGLYLSTEHLEMLRRYTTENLSERTPMQAYEQLADFFSLPWFRRVWVLQEAFSHHRISVRIGQLSLAWGSVILAALWQSFLTRTYTASSDKNERESSRQGAGYLPELWLGLLHNRVPRGLSIVELACRARDFQATDPRDKVFALLGLANDLADPEKRPRNLLPDYTKSKAQVYCGFAREVILMTRKLDILSAVDTFTAETHQNKPASWMPDLDISIATIRGLGFPPKYNAAFSTEVNPQVAVSNNPDDTVLRLSGLVVDHVGTWISSTLILRKDLRLCFQSDPDVDAVQHLWTDFAKDFYYSHPEESVLKSYMHILTSTGFALPTEFPAYPLGKVVPPHDIPSMVADLAAYWARSDPSFAKLRDPFHLLTVKDHGDADQFAVLAGKACHERKFFLSCDGRMGLCPRDARSGDAIVILHGGNVPYILRRLERGRGGAEWTLVGECYVDGMMFGEAKERKEARVVPDQIFSIG